MVVKPMSDAEEWDILLCNGWGRSGMNIGNGSQAKVWGRNLGSMCSKRFNFAFFQNVFRNKKSYNLVYL